MAETVSPLRVRSAETKHTGVRSPWTDDTHAHTTAHTHAHMHTCPHTCSCVHLGAHVCARPHDCCHTREHTHLLRAHTHAKHVPVHVHGNTCRHLVTWEHPCATCTAIRVPACLHICVLIPTQAYTSARTMCMPNTTHESTRSHTRVHRCAAHTTPVTPMSMCAPTCVLTPCVHTSTHVLTHVHTQARVPLPVVPTRLWTHSNARGTREDRERGQASAAVSGAC